MGAEIDQMLRGLLDPIERERVACVDQALGLRPPHDPQANEPQVHSQYLDFDACRAA
jgi:hypothetical protein